MDQIQLNDYTRICTQLTSLNAQLPLVSSSSGIYMQSRDPLFTLIEDLAQRQAHHTGKPDW